MSESYNKYTSAFSSAAPRTKEDVRIDDTSKFLQKIRKFKPKFAVYNTILLSGLDSIRLADNQTFTTLKKELITFNDLVKDALVSKKQIPDYGFKSALLDGVRNRLREICQTEDHNLQLTLLERTNKWYESQLARKEGIREGPGGGRSASVGTKRDGSVEKENSSLGKSFILPPKTKRDPLPSEFREIVLRDYEQGNRTLQGDSTPPYEKIKEYERKLPVKVQHVRNNDGTQISVSIPDRISTSPYRHYDPSFQGSKGQFSPDVSPMRNHASNRESITKEAEEKPKEGGEEQVKPTELLKPEKTEEEKDEEGEDDGKEGEDDENETPMVKFDERKVFTEDRKVGMVYLQTDQLVPIEKRSNYVYHQPKGDTTELDLERRYREYLHKRLMVKREQEEMVTMMDEWAHAKSRIDEDISRRNESMRYTSRFERRGWSLDASRSGVKAGVYRPDNSQLHPHGLRGVLPGAVHQEERVLGRNRVDLSKIETPQEIDTTRESIMNQVRVVIYKEERKEAGEVQHQPKLINYSTGRVLNSLDGEERRGRTVSVEREAGKKRIARIRELHGSVISATDSIHVEQNEEDRRILSMSIYDPMHNLQTGYRRLSETLSRFDNARLVNQSINEIDAIKRKAAQNEIPIQMKALTSSLLIPTPVSRTKLRPLPQPGGALMANPFIKEKKKGRK